MIKKLFIVAGIAVVIIFSLVLLNLAGRVYYSLYMKYHFNNYDEAMKSGNYNEARSTMLPVVRKMLSKDGDYFAPKKITSLIAILKANSHLEDKNEEMTKYAEELVNLLPPLEVVSSFEKNAIPANLSGDDSTYAEKTGPLIKAAIEKQYEKIKEERPKLNEKLSAAVADDNVLAAEDLLDKWADPNARDAKGKTPLMRAVQAGNKRAAELLLARGADVNAVDNEGKPAFDQVSQKNFASIINLLLKYGAGHGANKPKIAP